MIKATRELKEAVGPGQRGGQDRLEPALGLPGRNPPKKKTFLCLDVQESFLNSFIEI